MELNKIYAKENGRFQSFYDGFKILEFIDNDYSSIINYEKIKDKNLLEKSIKSKFFDHYANKDNSLFTLICYLSHDIYFKIKDHKKISASEVILQFDNIIK